MVGNLTVEYWPIDRPVPNARNARTHSPEQVTQIAASIRAFGFVNPVLVDPADNDVIAGHGRLAAAREIGLAEVPVIPLAGLSATQKRALRLADNKLALNAGWDDALLRLELADLRGLAFDMSVIGFGASEVSALLDATQGRTDPDETPDPPADPVTEMGDLWLLGAKVTCPHCRKTQPLEAAIKR